MQRLILKFTRGIVACKSIKQRNFSLIYARRLLMHCHLNVQRGFELKYSGPINILE